MEIIFKCSNCEQELEVDASGAGTQINCPTCNAAITVPNAEPANIVTMPDVTNAARREEKHFKVPVRETPGEVLIKQASRKLDIPGKDGERTLRVKSIRRSECQEGGRNFFDERVSEFLEMVGQPNIISINAISYSHNDGAGHILHDYGVLIVFKG
jgi:DNA-directed RNA polymerase subunit RPC12/RpoP